MKNLRENHFILNILEQALLEDIGEVDITTDAIISDDLKGIGKIIVKENGIIAGLEVAELIFEIADEGLNFHYRVPDGSYVESGTLVAAVAGNLSSIIIAERIVLNFLQRMSGIATLTSKYVKEVEGTNAKIYDTRKTAPGLRYFDKLAVKIGGGENHRFGLNDMFLIKENHIASVNGVLDALNLCYLYKEDSQLDCKIEVEVRTLEELNQVLESKKADMVLLDNFSLEDISVAVKRVNHQIEVEASGGVTLQNLRQIAETGVDRISVGALTHSVKALDISLLIEK